MRVIGLTGGIGSGKSTVAKMFADLGVATLDLDDVGKILLDDSDVQSALVSSFGASIIEHGVIARKQLAEIAFSNAENTQKLNHILHPHIRAYEAQWVQKQSGVYVVVEASVLIESGNASRMDALMIVMADLELRKRRVLARGKQDALMFERIVQRQCDDDTRLHMANYLIDNNGDMQALEAQVRLFHQQISLVNNAQ
jgi:dephospho-CoA kinase